MKKENSVRCPHCGNPVSAEDEDALVKATQQHMKEMHNTEISEQQAEDTIKQQAGA
jgi:predicted small metal-binding protein